MNPKIDSKIIAQKGLKSTYNEPPRLIDAKQLPKPSLVDFLQSISLCKEDKKSREEEDYVISYCIAKNAITILYAPAGSGKTFAAWAIAKYAYLTKKVTHVHYLDGDNGLSTLFSRRVDELFKYSKFSYISLNNPRIAEKLNSKTATGEGLLRYCSSLAFNCDIRGHLIIVDSLKDFVESNDIESGKDMNLYFRSVLMALRYSGATIICLHHTNKAVKDSKNGEINENILTFTGSQMIPNNIDTAYLVLQTNRATNKSDGKICYRFLPEKDRLGCASFRLTVYTTTTQDKKIYDINIEIEDIWQELPENKRKIVEKIINLLKNNHGILPVENIYKLFSKHRRDKKVGKILNDFNGIFWEKPSKSPCKKAEIRLKIAEIHIFGA